MAKQKAKQTARPRARGTVGIIGLGIMGGSFGRNLAQAGWRVVGFDLDPARRRAARRSGVEIADSAAGVARIARDIIVSLPTARALDAVCAELVRSKQPPRVVIEASTFTIEDKERAEAVLRKAGHAMLDCTVSGTGAQARVKDLIFYASGDTRTIRRLRPLFRDFGREVYDLGAFGNGSKMKYVANLLVAIHNVAAAEAMVLGMKAGLDPKLVCDLANAGAGQSRMFQLRGPMMAANDYKAATMKVGVWKKDMQVIGDFARRIGVRVPVFRATAPIYAAALRAGHAEDDTASVCAVLETMAGLERPAPSGSTKRRTALSRKV